MQFKELNKKFKSINLREGDIIFSQGDKSGDGYIIEYGNIKLTKYNETFRFPILGSGEIFGVWKVLFDREERFFTATAVNNTGLLVIPEDLLLKELSSMDPFLRHCFKEWIPLSEHFK